MKVLMGRTVMGEHPTETRYIGDNEKTGEAVFQPERDASTRLVRSWS